MITKSAFKPAWWLRNNHLQTVFRIFYRSLPALSYRSERIGLPDGDFVNLLWVDEGVASEAPLVVLLPGLCSDELSNYIKAQILSNQKMGWRSVILQHRGTGSEPNRKMRAYHAGDTADLDYVLRVITEREPRSHKLGVGFSLGGNILLKWLGEYSSETLLSAAVVVSVPFKLNLVADRLNQGVSRCYQTYLLSQLRQNFMRKKKLFPNAKFFEVLKSCRCFWTFDHNITAPLNGFDGAHHYYHEASSHLYLANISTPTLIIHAADDPLMTPEVLPNLNELSSSVLLELSERGGHVGFVSGCIPLRPKFWLDKRIPEFFEQQFALQA